MLTSLTNVPRDFDWGSTTLLAELEDRTPTGLPEAEVWFGDHHASPAVTSSGQTLPELLAEHGAPPLPYLLKLLAAGGPLSIQVHPTRSQAEAGFAAEQGLSMTDAARNYFDSNHKPELIVALSDEFDALCGLRDRDETLDLLDALPPLAGVRAVRQRLAVGEPADALRGVITWVLTDAPADVTEDISAALHVAARNDSLDFADAIACVAAAADAFPGDPGIVVALLMNFVTLRRGEGMFLSAGILHTYQAGLGVEIMAASDNVLRGGLTTKRVDVPELMTLVDTTPTKPQILRADAVSGVAGLGSFGPGVEDFSLALATPGASDVTFASTGPTMVLATNGELTVSADGVAVQLKPGQVAFRMDGLSPVTVSGTGEAFIATPGATPPHAPDTP